MRVRVRSCQPVSGLRVGDTALKPFWWMKSTKIRKNGCASRSFVARQLSYAGVWHVFFWQKKSIYSIILIQTVTRGGAREIRGRRVGGEVEKGAACGVGGECQLFIIF